MKKKTKQAGPAAWLQENKWTCAVLAAALVLLIVGRLLAAPARVEAGQPEERADYESAVVEQVLSDSTEKDPAADNGYRGAAAAGYREVRGLSGPADAGI